MSEYMDKTSVNKLIGANPGYVGYDEGGLMTEQIKNKKHCVILLDEIEKADPEVYNIFLQVFDEGFLTDNSGMKVDFKNTIIILTSNAGAKAASEFGKGIGFTENEDNNTKKILMKKLKNRFPPEFLNRLDDIIYFNKLSDDNLKEIVRLEMNKMCDRVIGIGHLVDYDEASVEHILNMVKNESEFGARPIIRAIENEYEDRITDLILTNDYQDRHTFHITCFSDDNVSVV
jgi:ATP-dependent Clp protease ATP-binding subunit ClpC